MSESLCVTPQGEYSEAAGPEHEGATAGLGVSDVTPILIHIPRLAAIPMA
jgi:hypothetical protein